MQMKKRKISLTILSLSTLYALFLLNGYAIKKTGTIDMLYSSFNSFGKYFIILVIFIIFFYFIIFFLFKGFNNIKDKKKTSNLYYFLFEKHPFLTPFIIYFLVGLPIVIFYYPGSVQWDGMRQLDYFFGMIPWTNHHPAFSTLVMGLCVKIGRILVNDNFGVFLFTFPQYILSCGVFSYLLLFLKKIDAPKGCIVFSFLFFLLNPLWYINSYTLIKDTLFYLFFLLFTSEFIKAWDNEKNPTFLLISALLVFFFRNNGFYIVLASFITLFLFHKGHKKRYGLYIILTILTQVCFNQVIAWSNIAQGSIHEMLSVPLQQTARYVKNYDLEEDEKEIIERLFHMDTETIKKKYKPEISDPIKFSFEVENTSELIEYFRVWGKGLIKHPKVYFDAFFENYYGYIYPFRREYKDGLAYFTIEQSKTVNLGNFDFYMSDKFTSQRKTIFDTINYVRNIPLIEVIFNTGTYTWILVLFMGYAIYRKKYRCLIASTPILLALAFCFLSPVNAYVRYMNPIIVTIPLYIGYVLANTKEKKGKKNGRNSKKSSSV